MSTITITDLTAADLGDEEAFNSRFGVIVSKLNTGLDTDNLLAGAATRAKIGQGAITQSKMNNTFTWITPTLGTSWAHWADPNYGDAQYYKDARGTVRMRGIVNRPSGSANLIFTLPTGYRPGHRLIFTVWANGSLSRIDVLPNGEVVWASGQAQTHAHSLANIHFRAVQ